MTDGQTDKQTVWTIHRAAWWELKKQITNTFSQENTFENIILKMAAILGPQYDINKCYSIKNTSLNKSHEGM